MQNNPQNQGKFYSFCDIQRDSNGERCYGVMEGTIHNYTIGPATRQDKTPVLNEQGMPRTVANFSVRLSNVAKNINFAMGDYNPQTKQSTPILDPAEETTFINVECWDERLISRLQSAGVKEKDRLILTGSLTKNFSQKTGRYYIRLRLSNFKITKRSDVQATTGDAQGQAVYGMPQMAQPGFQGQPAYAQPTGFQQAPAQANYPSQPTQPVAPAQPVQPTQPVAPVQPEQPMQPTGFPQATAYQQPTFDQGFQQAPVQPGFPGQVAQPGFQQPDFAGSIQINDEDLPF